MVNKIQRAVTRFMVGLPSMLQVAVAICAIVLIAFYAGRTHSAEPAASNDGKQYGEQTKNRVNTATSTIDPVRDIPGYQGTDVPETRYANSGEEIQGEARTSASTNTTAQFIEGSMATRPSYTIDPQHDPMFSRTHEIENLSYSLTNTYQGCVDLPVGSANVTNTTNRSCKVFGTPNTRTEMCTRQLTFTCPTGNPNNGTCPAQGIAMGANPSGLRGSYVEGKMEFEGTNSWGINSSRCIPASRTMHFAVTDLSKVESFILREAHYFGGIQITLNGTVIHDNDGFYEYDGVGSGQTCSGLPHSDTNLSIDVKQLIVQGDNTFTLRTLRGYGIELDVLFDVNTPQVESVVESCPSGFNPAGYTPASNICTSGSETRIIGGVPIHRECWSWDTSYILEAPPTFTEEPLCETIRNEGCTQISATCTIAGAGFCAEQTLMYQCTTISPARTVSLCGSNYVCPEGNCTAEYQTQEDATASMQQAVTTLQVANEVAKGYAADNLSIFRGRALECENKSFGASNCCVGSGWADDAGLHSCSSEEKELGAAREAFKTHYVGNYDSGPWYNESNWKVFCVYPSKLSRIIVEQGIDQLNRNYGSAKHADCKGFTIEEFQRLNLEAMDFSEFYQDTQRAAEQSTQQMPSQQELIDRIKTQAENGGGQ